MNRSAWLVSMVFGLCLSSAALPSCASPSTALPVAQSAPNIPEAKRFMFDRWAGPALPVWYLRPAGTPPDAPVVFVMHGVKRDADRYLME